MSQHQGYMPPSAAASIERIHGFLQGTERGHLLTNEVRIARDGLDIVADYKQVVSRLASAAATLLDPHSEAAKLEAQKVVFDCIEKLQTIRSDL